MRPGCGPVLKAGAEARTLLLPGGIDVPARLGLHGSPRSCQG